MNPAFSKKVFQQVFSLKNNLTVPFPFWGTNTKSSHVLMINAFVARKIQFFLQVMLCISILLLEARKLSYCLVNSLRFVEVMRNLRKDVLLALQSGALLRAPLTLRYFSSRVAPALVLPLSSRCLLKPPRNSFGYRWAAQGLAVAQIRCLPLSLSTARQRRGKWCWRVDSELGQLPT